jgi:transcription elongation factor GreA
MMRMSGKRPLNFFGANMPTKTITLTKEGLEHLKAELKELKEVKRPEVIARIKSAQELGDLSENAEYQSAKEDQSFIEGRIQELETMIKSAKVIERTADSSIVGIGSKVVVDIEGDKIEYEIVGPTESDIENNRISSESPVARSLMGRKKGEKVTVLAPGGDIEYKILEVK